MAAMEASKLFEDQRFKPKVDETRFKAKIDGKLKSYTSQTNDILKEAYVVPGLRTVMFNADGVRYSFDFKTMQQTCVNDLSVAEMRAPSHLGARPTKPKMFSRENFKAPLSKGRMAVVARMQPRSVFVVRVPEGSPGTTIEVPHPKKLGKAKKVFVPEEAVVGQSIFIPMHYKRISTQTKVAVCGIAGGGVGAAVGLGMTDVAVGTVAGGTVAGGVAALGPVILGGVVAAGTVAAGAAVVHYATKHPVKAALTLTLAMAGLAAYSHVAEVGVAEAAGDLAEGCGDIIESVGDAIEWVVDASGEDGWVVDVEGHDADVEVVVEEVEDLFSVEDGGDELDDVADTLAENIIDLF